ncbi:zinc finger, CCHC-type containing protein [Tanacetum coccineum]
MVVLSNIQVYSDYDFFDGHQMQSGGRKGIRFYLMEMDCMLSTSGWLVCEKQFSLMWLASSSASSNPLILIFYFFIYLIQKLRQKEVDEESCVKTCSMNWGEANSVYTSYIVSSASNGKIQAGALIFVLVGYIVRIYQKSQENRQKWANTDTGNGGVYKSWKLQSNMVKQSKKINSQFLVVYLFFALSVRNPFSSTTIGDENPIRTLGDYSRPSYKGYRNTIELPEGNNMVPLRSDTIRLVQNGCSFHGLRFEDPNQHLKDFFKLVDSLDLDGENRERTRLRLFQFSLRDQASNWLERLPAGSISTWEDLTTRFLAQFFPPGRTAKLRNDILMFQQHHGESLSEAWTHFKDLLQKVPYHGIDLWLQVQIFYDHVHPVTRRTIDQSAGGKLRNLNPEESWAILEDLALYDNESPEQACVDYASSHTNEIRGKKFTSNHGPRNFNDAANTWKDKPNFNQAHTQTFTSLQGGSISVHSSSYQMKLEKALLDFDSNQEKRLSHLRTQLEQQQDDMIGKINLLWKTVFEKLNDTSSPKNVGSSMAPRNIAAISHDEKEELRKKGIKSPSKLLSPKYLSPTSIKELNKNPSSLKRVHFVNLIVILSTDSDTEEEDASSTNACNLDLGGMAKGKEELKEKGKEENEMEADMEVEEEESEFETDEEQEDQDPFYFDYK